MVEPSLPPRVTALQRAWLTELGLAPSMLARWLTPEARVPGIRAGVSSPEPDIESGATAPRVGGATGGLRAISALLAQPSLVEPRSSPDEKDGARRDRPVNAPVQRVASTEAGSDTQATEYGSGPVMPVGDLAALREQVLQCRACALCEGRSQAVFGEGALASVEWMVVGEAPGDHDDRTGRPFQGDAGALLTGMLAAMGVADDSVYFTNLIKCRPLGNRPPSRDEIAACLPYLRRQIALLAPRRILALGRLAAQALTGGGAELDQLRGAVHAFEGEDGRRIPLVVTYHPASLLLQPQHKPEVWRDLILARGVMA